MNNMPPSVILRLTPRLIEILHFVSHGATNAQIGKILHISEDTVKVHIRRLLRALDARNRAHIVRRGFEYGLLEKGSETA
jgi:DNA-binding NarL/FixJ family response regulator